VHRRETREGNGFPRKSKGLGGQPKNSRNSIRPGSERGKKIVRKKQKKSKSSTERNSSGGGESKRGLKKKMKPVEILRRLGGM